jgi:hypothetical protein
MKMKTLNEWFLSLSEERQKILREDKWMLANAAFEFAYQSGRDAQRESDASLFLIHGDYSSSKIVYAIKNNTGDL